MPLLKTVPAHSTQTMDRLQLERQISENRWQWPLPDMWRDKINRFILYEEKLNECGVPVEAWISAEWVIMPNMLSAAEKADVEIHKVHLCCENIIKRTKKTYRFRYYTGHVDGLNRHRLRDIPVDIIGDQFDFTGRRPRRLTTAQLVDAYCHWILGWTQENEVYGCHDKSHQVKITSP